MTRLKKIVISSIAAVSAFCAAAAFAACTPSVEERHNFGEWRDLVNTCTEHVQVRACADCGLEQTKELETDGHDFGDWTAAPSACGTETRTCSVCDYTEIREPDTVKHSFGGWENVVDTCNERVRKRECEECGFIEVIELGPKGHNFGEGEGWRVLTNSCTNRVEIRVCQDCGWKEYKISKTEHAFGEWRDLVNTCTEHILVRTCNSCGAEETKQAELRQHNFFNDRCVDCGKIGYKGEALDWLDAYNGTYGLDYYKANSMLAQQIFYTRIDEAARLFHVNGATAEYNPTSISSGPFYEAAKVNFDDLGLTADEAISVWKTFKDDNPLYYWLSNGTSVTSDGTQLYLKCYEDYKDGATRTAANELVVRKVGEYVAKINPDDSAYLKALAFHDLIINAIDYAYEPDGTTPSSEGWAHNILGVFEERGGTCETYTRVFQLLLNYIGVENVAATGTANGSGHTWNLVKLDDGKWYWCDLTWDDTPTLGVGISYDYFMVNDTQVINSKTFLQTHVCDTPDGKNVKFLYELPERAETEFESPVLMKTFNTQNAMYAVTGYKTVRLVKSLVRGELSVPETVLNAGVTYTVIAIGALGNGSFASVLMGEETTIAIPETVRYIADYSFGGGSSLTSLTFNGSHERFDAINKGDDWCYGTGNLKIVCSDGTYDKDGNLLS